MTTLPTWLRFPPVQARTLRTLVCTPLRSTLPGRSPATRQDLPRLRPGVERC